MSCLQHFEQMPHFESMCLYPMFLNNELCQYSCLISDRRVPCTPVEEKKESDDGEDDYNIELLQVREKTKSAVVIPKAIEKSQSV